MPDPNPAALAVKAISLLGIPFDANSSYLRGPAQAPQAIRGRLYSGSSNLWTEDGIDLGRPDSFHDAGDVALPDDAKAAFLAIEAAVKQTLDLGHPLICLSGDHSVTYPTIKAFHARYPDLTILHFDAHPDLYDVLDGNRLSHACPFARIMEEHLARRLVQVGIRTINQHQLSQATRFGVEVITMRNLDRFSSLKFEGPLFISLDLDVLDPAFAPGISHYEPGGMSVREVLDCIQGLKVPVVGADIVEYNPTRDLHGQTAMVCAKFLKEIAAAVLRKDNVAPSVWP
ncbi:MAG: agmatinase [Acidobacteriia bacterium]|nr:agmatinase [Terriglobia bacterium]